MHAGKQNSQRTEPAAARLVSTAGSSAARLRFCPTAGSAVAVGPAAVSELLGSRDLPAVPPPAPATTEAKIRCTMLPTTSFGCGGSTTDAAACCLSFRLPAVGSRSGTHAAAAPAPSSALVRASPSAAAPPDVPRSRKCPVSSELPFERRPLRHIFPSGSRLRSYRTRGLVSSAQVGQMQLASTARQAQWQRGAGFWN